MVCRVTPGSWGRSGRRIAQLGISPPLVFLVPVEERKVGALPMPVCRIIIPRYCAHNKKAVVNGSLVVVNKSIGIRRAGGDNQGLPGLEDKSGRSRGRPIRAIDLDRKSTRLNSSHLG